MTAAGGEKDDLLVFGYECKLFRDDEKALSIDRGDHLIPWMGKEDHPIDRYDARAALHDLQGHEQHFDDPQQFLSSEERALELACDEERYCDMDTTGQSSSSSSSSSAAGECSRGGNEVALDYDNVPQARKNEDEMAAAAQRQEMPSLKTLANCIEKTAEFIVSQGPQMEILMRAKEANNLKFQFLNPDNPYHPIYKQVLEKKKSRPKNYGQQQQPHNNVIEVEKSLQKLVQSLPTAAPNLESKQQTAASTPYSILVQKMRPLVPAVVPKVKPEPKESPAAPPPAKKEPENPNIVEVTPPPIALQPLIDKTASYVAKNGADMMPVVRKTQPEKFAFLHPENKYNNYFLYKVALYGEMLAEERKTSNGDKTKNGSNDKREPSHEEQVQQVTSKFPTLKGFFR